MRPMAVVRAGDAQSSLNTQDSEPPESEGRHTLSDGVDQLASPPNNAHLGEHNTGDRITPLVIPPPPAVPFELIAESREPPLSTQGAKQSNSVSAAENRSSAKPSVSDYSSSETVTPSPRVRYGTAAIALACFSVLAIVLAAVSSHRNRTEPAASASGKSAARAPEALVAAVPSAAALQVNEVRAPAPEAAAPTEEVAAAASSAPPATNRVTLELMPIDAKVFLHGREISGPPFEFDVPPKRRLALEVKRPGFVTAKVVIDGKRPLVHFGMLRDGQRRPR